QVRYLYRLSQPALIGTLAAAGLTLYALYGQVSTQLLAAWFVAMLATMAARHALAQAYFRQAPAPDDAQPWGRRFVLGAGPPGLLWGLVGSALFPAASIPHQFLVIFVIGGMVVPAMVMLAPLKQAFYAYMLPALALTIGPVFAQGTPQHLFMGL